MIFVTVGMHPRSFDRLVRAADEIAPRVRERVVIQRGSATYAPIFAESFDFVAEAKMEELVEEARVVVSHAGAGTILRVMQAGKPLVVVPRLERFGEHIDDHQLELAQVVVERQIAVQVIDLSCDSLLKAVEAATCLSGRETVSTQLHTALTAWLARQDPKPGARRSGLLHLGRRGG